MVLSRLVGPDEVVDATGLQVLLRLVQADHIGSNGRYDRDNVRLLFAGLNLLRRATRRHHRRFCSCGSARGIEGSGCLGEGKVESSLVCGKTLGAKVVIEMSEGTVSGV